MLPTAIHYTPGSNGVLPPTAFLYNSLLIWSLNAISTDFGTAGWNERFREFLLASAIIPACLSALDPRPESERTWLSTPPPIQCSPFWSPLLFMLYWSKELPNPLPNPPPALTRTHIYTHTPTQAPQTKQNSWNCSDWGGLEKERSGRGGAYNWRKEKKQVKVKKKKNLQKQIPWIPLAVWVAVVLLQSECPPCPISCLFPHSGNYDICYGGGGGGGEGWGENRGGGRETGTRVKGKGGFIVNERPAHPCTSMAKKKNC